MDFKVNVLGDSEHELEVKLEYSEIKNEIDEAYKKERKTLTMPGFRKGKVPLLMLKKVYGEAIEFKASEDIANKMFWDVVKKEDLKPINTPQMTDLNFQINDSLSFKVKYEVLPVISVKDYTGLEIEKPIFNVNDDDIKSEVNNMLKSKAAFELADMVENSNFRITVDLQRVDEDGKDIEGSKSENMVIDLSDSKINENIVKNAQNKKLGEEFEFSFTDKHMHGDHEHVEDYHYLAVVKKIEQIKMPEPTEELIGELSGKKAKTIEELTEFIKSNYENYYKNQSDKIYDNSLISEIIKNNDFEPPKGYVENLLKHLIESEKQNARQYKQTLPNENVLKESLKNKAEWNAKWQIIMESIAKKENIEVTDADLEKLAKEESEKISIPVDKLIKYYKDSNKKSSMIEEKVFEFLKENNTVKEIDNDKKAKEIKDSKKTETETQESIQKNEIK